MSQHPTLTPKDYRKVRQVCREARKRGGLCFLSQGAMGEATGPAQAYGGRNSCKRVVTMGLRVIGYIVLCRE